MSYLCLQNFSGTVVASATSLKSSLLAGESLKRLYTAQSRTSISHVVAEHPPRKAL